MTRLIPAVDRLLAIVLGVALVGGGSFALAWYHEVPPARRMWARFDREIFASLPFQYWWEAALAGTALVCALVAVALLIGNLSPRRTGTAQISVDESMAVRVDLAALARGVAAELATFPEVTSARGRAVDDRGTATLAVTVQTTPHIDIDAFTHTVERKAEFVSASLEGSTVALRVQMHVGAAQS